MWCLTLHFVQGKSLNTYTPKAFVGGPDQPHRRASRGLPIAAVFQVQPYIIKPIVMWKPVQAVETNGSDTLLPSRPAPVVGYCAWWRRCG